MKEETMIEKKSNKRWLFIVLAVVVLAAIACVVFVISTKGSNNSLEEHLQLGDRYLSEMEYDKAVAEFKKALDIEPDNQEVLDKLNDAYLAWADSEVLSGDIEHAVSILAEGYEFTKSDLLYSRMEVLRVDLTQDSDLAPSPALEANEEETEQDYSGFFSIPEKVVDGIYHVSCDKITASAEDIAVLDNILSLCRNGDTEAAAKVLDTDEWYGFIENHGPVLQFGYNFYKFYYFYYDDSNQINETDMWILPIEDGQGYLIGHSYLAEGKQFETRVWGQGECTDGMYNGKMRIEYFYDDVGIPMNGYTEGMVNNWKWDGEVKDVVYSGYYQRVYGNTFVDGRPIKVIEKDGYSYYMFDEDGKSRGGRGEFVTQGICYPIPRSGTIEFCFATEDSESVYVLPY